MMVHRPKRFRLSVANAALLILHSPYGWTHERVNEEGRCLPGPSRIWCGRDWCSEETCDCHVIGWPTSDGLRWTA